MNWYKKAKNELGHCLKEALKLIDKNPSYKLMMGSPSRKEDTSHFWTVDENGNINDPASDVVDENYNYKGREVDPNKIKIELGIK